MDDKSVEQEKINLFAGMNLEEVRSYFNLEDNAINITMEGTNNTPKLCIEMYNKKYFVPFNVDFPLEKLENFNFLLKCGFRINYTFKKNEFGEYAFDNAGDLHFDDSKTFLYFDKPRTN